MSRQPSCRRQLLALGACDEAVAWVGHKSLREAWEACPRGDWMAWLCDTLGLTETIRPEQEAYDAAVRQAWEAYDAAVRQAWEAYDAAVRPARTAYVAAARPARKAYVAAVRPARKAYADAIRAVVSVEQIEAALRKRRSS